MLISPRLVAYLNGMPDFALWFNVVGFWVLREESQASEGIARALPSLAYLHRFSYDDAVTSMVTVCLEKPHSPALASS